MPEFSCELQIGLAQAVITWQLLEAALATQRCLAQKAATNVAVGVP